MVDLSTCKTVMRKSKKAREYIDPDAFHLARRKAGLTVQRAAIELDVNERTIRNYENGAVRIPYPAFRLMRLLAGFQLVTTGRHLKSNWDDWCFWQNKLWTPDGRSFEPHELRYVATYISLARHFLKTRDATAQEHSSFAAETVIEIIGTPSPARARPSNATALFGAKVAHETVNELAALQACREKAA